MQSTPTLPLELVERIVNFAGQESEKDLILVSRQFHASTLRNIYRHQSLKLRARPDFLSNKYDRLFGDQFMLGGCRGHHVRELSIQFDTWPRVLGKTEAECKEDILFRLLEAFSSRTGLQALFVRGNDKWESLPLKVRDGLRILMRSPSLCHLSVREVHSFPAAILHGNKALRDVELIKCRDVMNVSDHAVMLPGVTTLWSRYSKPPKNGILLPCLQILTAHHSNLVERLDSWVRMGRTREELRHISIFDNESAQSFLSVITPPPLTLFDRRHWKQNHPSSTACRSEAQQFPSTPVLGLRVRRCIMEQGRRPPVVLRYHSFLRDHLSGPRIQYFEAAAVFGSMGW